MFSLRTNAFLKLNERFWHNHGSINIYENCKLLFEPIFDADRKTNKLPFERTPFNLSKRMNNE